MRQVNISEQKDKGGVSLENNAIQDLQEKTISTKDYSHEATEMAKVSTSSVSNILFSSILENFQHRMYRVF